ncbi:MAG: ATP-binding cassette domain-containing protein [Streptosporangiales bacterium]|nr:ATP-binding cassette domain-containing protein [Streptosporangiales bacterium]
MDSPELEIDGLRRRYDTVTALDGLTFGVRAGELFGFLGPNGSGKTTTMRAIFGVTALDSGQIRWRGRPVDAAARRTFGYMPEERGLYPTMELLDQVTYFAELHGLSAASAARAARYWIERLGLASRERTRIDALSHGNQQRAQLAVALVHDPELLVLDEPFSGLDPGGIDAMSAVLAERAAAGVTVLFSSHQLDLVEDICQSVAIIHRGRLVASGPVADLRRGDRPRLVVRVAGDRAAAWAADLGSAGTPDTVRADGTAEISVPSPEGSQPILDLARAAGRVEHFAFEDRSLSEVFRLATGASVGQAEAEHAAGPAEATL